MAGRNELPVVVKLNRQKAPEPSSADITPQTFLHSEEGGPEIERR